MAEEATAGPAEQVLTSGDFNASPKGRVWHLVEARWYCACEDVEACRSVVYLSDVRIALAERVRSVTERR